MSLFVADRLGADGFDASPPSPDFALEFSELLDRFGYGDRFGISLLHRHWESPDEVLVERPAGPAEARIGAVGRGELPADAIAVQWACEKGALVAAQFCAIHEQPPPPPPE